MGGREQGGEAKGDREKKSKNLREGQTKKDPGLEGDSQGAVKGSEEFLVQSQI